MGAIDEFGKSRAAEFWETRQLARAFGDPAEPGQGCLLPPPSLGQLPRTARNNPTQLVCLAWETELCDFPSSGHPLELHPDTAWKTYCPVARRAGFLGREVITCGLILKRRTHHQVTGEPIELLTLGDWTGMLETGLFAKTFRTCGRATVH